MIFNKSQRGGNNSNNIQADRVQLGLSLNEAREVALGVFRENFLEIQGVARQVAEERAAWVAERLILKLQHRDMDASQHFKEPSMLHALYAAQKAFAKSGEPELLDILVELLEHRCSETTRSRRQLILSEAISKVDLLTPRHLHLLSLLLLTSYSHRDQIPEFGSLQEAVEYVRSAFFWLSGDLDDLDSELDYLEYAGCLRSGQPKRSKPLDCLISYSSRAFSKGFSATAIEGLGLSAEQSSNIFLEEEGSIGSLRLRGLRDEENESILNNFGIFGEVQARLRSLQRDSVMNSGEVEELLEGLCPGFRHVHHLLSSQRVLGTGLTPVGFAIGYVMSRGRIPGQKSLEVWLP